MLAISFTLVASSFTENTQAATLEPSSTPGSALPLTVTSTFAYAAKGQECSSMRAPKTFTLCNYTTPPDTGVIVQISVYLTGIPVGSNVWAVIFANEPDANFPQGGEPLAQSLDALKVTSVSGEWYNFSMNYPASQNTVYWLGYYSDNSTRYFFDADSDHLSVTSQPKDENSNWPPVGWYYGSNSIMSLYALYTVADPQPSPTHTYSSISDNIETSGVQDTLFVLLIIGAETAILVTDQNRKKENTLRGKFYSKV